jgi:RNA polymerase sigma factor (sigma-70 family)
MQGFEEVYRQHLNAVFRYAQRVVGRRDVAEELTSDAFISLWKIFDTIDTSQLPGWLFTAVRNRAIDYWRRAGEALAGARWYADPHGDAWKALKFEAPSPSPAWTTAASSGSSTASSWIRRCSCRPWTSG